MTKKEKALLDTFSRLRELTAQKALIEKELRQLNASLQQAIPPGHTVAGLTHRTSTGSSISYAKLFSETRELIPRTKQRLVDDLVVKHTTTFEKHKIVEAR